MKKSQVLNLIKYFTDDNKEAFINEAYSIASDFNNSGDTELGEYINSLLSGKNTFIPQDIDIGSSFFHKVNISNVQTIALPEAVTEELEGIENAIEYKTGVNKFLFSGAPGTGKTESCRIIAEKLGRELFEIDFEAVIDSKLGQTSKNIAEIFREINALPYPDQAVILFDEIDALAMDRINQNDIREMGRATSSVLKGLDELNPNIVLIATTNLIDSFDKALLRRFDKVVDFNRYTREDLIEVSQRILDNMLKKFGVDKRNTRLFTKIISLYEEIPAPGELKNLIRSSIAFSNPKKDFDYLRLLLKEVYPELCSDLKGLKERGFTLREIEILTGIPKSTAARELKENDDE